MDQAEREIREEHARRMGEPVLLSDRDRERIQAAQAHLEAEPDGRTTDRAEHHVRELLGVIARLTDHVPPLPVPPPLPGEVVTGT